MTQGNPDKEDTPEGNNDGPLGESLAQRSARLEEEASAIISYEPLAPEELDEGIEEESPEHEESEAPDTTKALQNELDITKDKMMRALAEVENTRRRAQKERADASKFAISNFAKEVVNVADNLRRALDSVPEDLIQADARIKNLLDGIEATERELLRSFEKNGIQRLEPVDNMFDPNFHEVMFETPGTGKPAGTVVQVIETGYMLNDRLLRPARVGIAKDEGQGSGDTPPTDPGGTIDTEA